MGKVALLRKSYRISKIMSYLAVADDNSGVKGLKT